MRRSLLAAAACAISAFVLVSCGGGSSVPDATPTPSPSPSPSPTATTPPRDRFEAAPCAFGDTGETVECGYLTVQENRSRPEEGTIRLHVARFHSRSASPRPDPVVYLEGGPGGSILSALQYGLPYNSFDAILEERDLILFDQRGTGYSEPRLDCPEVATVTRDAIRDPISPAEAEPLALAAYTACRDRLRGEGIALDSYNSRESSADMDEIRQALGIETWDVYGISYGTRLALGYMRDYPDAVRSAVLDSTYSPEVDLIADTVLAAHRAFDALFAACAADEACGTAYPNLERDFFDTVARLDATAGTTDVYDTSSGASFQAQVTGDELLGAIFLGMYNEYNIPDVPRMMADAASGDLSSIGYLLSIPISFSDSIAFGMHTSVQCNEDVSFSSQQHVDDVARPYPELAHFVDTDISFPLCALWGAGDAPAIENEPVRTNIPTLVLSGEFDPITPPEWGRDVAAQQTPGYFFQYPGLAHGATVSAACPISMMAAFLDEPSVSPDASCIASMPQVAFSAG